MALPVTLCVFGLLTCCCWWTTNLLDFWPVKDASEAARRYAAKSGYRMDGFYGDFIRQPDEIGECEVRIEFYDLSDDPPKRKVTVYLRRAWRLSGWEVTNMTAEKISDTSRPQ